MSERDLSSELRRVLRARSNDPDRAPADVRRPSTLLEEIGLAVEPVRPGPDPRRRTLDESTAETGPLPAVPVVPTLPDEHGSSRQRRALDRDALLDGRRIGRFQPLRVLGEGSMGIVLEARDPELGRSVALKVLRNPRRISDAAVARFLTEARLTAQLDHPGIVPVHELGVADDGVLFFVMQKVRGRSLREILERRQRQDAHDTRVDAIGSRRLLTAMVQICHALAYAHERGVVHRDLKPENIMVGDFGEVVIMDWGVARISAMAEVDTDEIDDVDGVLSGSFTTRARPRTLHGTAIGTPGYMSPEQALGEVDRLGAHSDVFSVGCLLYEVLTLRPAYEAASIVALMAATVREAPPDPRDHSRDARIPDELGELCVRAMASEPAARPTAAEIARTLERFLEGAQARDLAAACVEQARQAWQRHRELRDERDELRTRLKALEATTPPWTPPEQKADLFALRGRLRQLDGDLADAYEGTVAGCERALGHDRRYNPAHSLLAEAYWHRLEAASQRGDAQAARHYAWRLRTHDQGEYAELLDGPGRLTLDTSPTGARVWCQAFERGGLVWTLGERRLLGTTPLHGVELPRGSYLLCIEADGYRDTRYPVHLHHGRRHWRVEHPVRLFTDEEIGTGWCYVPAGPFVCGGDDQAIDAFTRDEPWVDGFFMAELPVTSDAYREFLDAIHHRDPDEAWQRTPREISGRGGVSLGQHWHRPAPNARYEVPLSDRAGDRWEADWPVIAIGWDDAQAYAAWRTEVTGQVHRLPRELEWEKAARGVDGRAFPWGDVFDASLCLMRDSRPGNRLPDVVGKFASDVSVYGVRDLAGSVGEWCQESLVRGDSQRRLVRGGSWLGGSRRCRAASRDVLDLSWVYPSVGFRLLRSAG